MLSLTSHTVHYKIKYKTERFLTATKMSKLIEIILFLLFHQLICTRYQLKYIHLIRHESHSKIIWDFSLFVTENHLFVTENHMCHRESSERLLPVNKSLHRALGTSLKIYRDWPRIVKICWILFNPRQNPDSVTGALALTTCQVLWQLYTTICIYYMAFWLFIYKFQKLTSSAAALF